MEMSSLLGVRISTNPEKYLRLPNVVGRRKKESFQNLLDRVSVRIVVRDSKGHVFISCTEFHRGVASPFIAEVIACRRAAQTGLAMQRPETIIEGDSLSIVKKCKDVKLDKSQIGAYIHDIHEMKSRARKLRFEYILRSVNGLAHILATESLKRREEMYLVESTPSYGEGMMRSESVQEPD
ncbi:hypothetical protein PVK06_030012 [Gossypium arboreum]|uniref:RNase H type-1 domain-containing protein n=1 Tax=Gossypium arboreum TaxID=29729 RepID=A0ABR0NN85_GOSAR|nr:hypothetical protein PVK06_030012 [Gossypium arboreum]